MTVSTTAARIAYTGNASTTAFAFSFRFLATTDIAVYLDGVLQSTGYTVSAPGASGTVTFSTAPASGVSVVITRATAKTQETDYVANDAFSADSTELAFDRAMLAAQDNAAAIGRTIRAPDYAAPLDMSQFYGMGVGISASGAPVPLSLYTGAGALANASWQVGRNAADSASLNMWRINSANFLEPGTVQSYDNTGTHTNRSVPIEQSNYRNDSPSGVQFSRFYGINGLGDNTTFRGVGHELIIIADSPGVATGTRGVLYGTNYSIQLGIGRNNAPYDDVAAIVIQNDSAGATSKATEAIYFGVGANVVGSQWNALLGCDASADAVLFATGAYINGLDFARAGTVAATFTGAALHVGNNKTAVSFRNAANNADISGLSSNASDQVLLRGWVTEPPTTWTPTITAQTGTITTSSVNAARYSRAMGRVSVDVSITTGNIGTASGELRITMPYTAAASARFIGVDGAGKVALIGKIASGSNVLGITTFTTANAPWSNGNFYEMSGSFEVST